MVFSLYFFTKVENLTLAREQYQQAFNPIYLEHIFALTAYGGGQRRPDKSVSETYPKN
jgi:hypothetical protein